MVRDVDVARAVHRNAIGLAEAPAQCGHTTGAGAARWNLLHQIVSHIRDEDISVAVQRHAIGKLEASTQRIDGRVAGEGDHRAGTRAAQIDGRHAYRRCRVVIQQDRAHSLSGIFRRKGVVDRAAQSGTVGCSCGAGAARCVGEVQIRRAQGQHLDGCGQRRVQGIRRAEENRRRLHCAGCPGGGGRRGVRGTHNGLSGRGRCQTAGSGRVGVAAWRAQGNTVQVEGGHAARRRLRVRLRVAARPGYRQRDRVGRGRCDVAAVVLFRDGHGRSCISSRGDVRRWWRGEDKLGGNRGRRRSAEGDGLRRIGRVQAVVGQDQRAADGSKCGRGEADGQGAARTRRQRCWRAAGRQQRTRRPAAAVEREVGRDAWVVACNWDGKGQRHVADVRDCGRLRAVRRVRRSDVGRRREAQTACAHIHLTDAVVAGVSDVDIPSTIHRHAPGIVDFRAGRRAAIAAETASPIARHRTDLSRAHIHLADAVVVEVQNVDIPCTIHRHACGRVEFRTGRRASIAEVTLSSIARHRTDISRARIHLADAVVAIVRNIDIPGAIHRLAHGIPEFRAGRHASIAVVTQSSIARHRTDLSRAHIHLTDAVVGFVRDVDIPCTIHRHASGREEFRAGRRFSIAVVTLSSIARHRTDLSRARIHLANAVVEIVRNVDIPGTIHRHASGIVEFRAGRHASIAVVTRSPIARHRADISRCVYLADALVVLVRDVDIPGTIQRHASGIVEFRAGRRVSIAEVTLSSIARYRADRSGGQRHLRPRANAIQPHRIDGRRASRKRGHLQRYGTQAGVPRRKGHRYSADGPGCGRGCAGGVYGASTHRPHCVLLLAPLGLRCGYAGNVQRTGQLKHHIFRRARPDRCRGELDSSGTHLADAHVAAVRNVDIPGTVHHHALGIVELRADRRASIAAVTVRRPLARHRTDISRARIHLTDAVVDGVRDVDIPGAVHRHAIGIVEFREVRRAVIAVESRSPITRNRTDVSRARIHLTDALVAKVRDVDIPCTVHRNAIGLVEFRASRQDAVAVVTLRPSARHRTDVSRGIHLTDAVVVAVRDVDIPDTIHRNASGIVEFRAGRQDAVDAITASSIARHRTDVSRARIHLTDAVVAAVRNVDIPGTIHRHAHGIVEFRAGRQDAVAAVTASSIARHRTDISRGVHLADAVVAGVRDVDIPRTIHRHAIGIVDFLAGRRAAIAAVTRIPIARYRADGGHDNHLSDTPLSHRQQRKQEQQRCAKPIPYDHRLPAVVLIVEANRDQSGGVRTNIMAHDETSLSREFTKISLY